MGVPDVERVLAVARARGRVAARADADGLVRAPDLQRLVPVARAHAADRGQAARVVGGRRAFGSVRLRQPCEIEPPRPVGDARARPRRATGTSARHDEHGDAEPARRVVRRRGALGEREADGEPDERAARRASRRRAIPSWWPAASRRASGDAVARSARSGRRPTGRRAPPPNAPSASTATPRRRSGTSDEPERHADRQREQRAARVGEQQRDGEQAERRVGERVDAPRGRCAGRRATGRPGTPSAAISPTRVPVAERLAQAGVDLVGVQRAGEDLRQHARSRRRPPRRGRRRRAATPSGPAHSRTSATPARRPRTRRASGSPRPTRRRARPPR